MRGRGSVANVPVLPVSSVANFQLWAVGARGGGQKRQECRFPEVRRVGVRVARLCPLSSVFCPPASVLCPLSSVLKGDEDKGQRTKDKGWRTLDIGTENRKTIEKHLALWRFIAVNCINSGRPSFVL